MLSYWSNLDGVLVRLENDVELEALVLRPVDELLVLRLARRHELWGHKCKQ